MGMCGYAHIAGDASGGFKGVGDPGAVLVYPADTCITGILRG